MVGRRLSITVAAAGVRCIPLPAERTPGRVRAGRARLRRRLLALQSTPVRSLPAPVRRSADRIRLLEMALRWVWRSVVHRGRTCTVPPGTTVAVDQRATRGIAWRGSQ